MQQIFLDWLQRHTTTAGKTLQPDLSCSSCHVWPPYIMTWKHESLLVIFVRRNVIPRISAAFSLSVLALQLNGLELQEKVINAQSPAAETELGALPSHLITSWSPMINGGGRAREQQNNDFVEKTGRCWYHPDPIYADLMVPAMSRAFNYRYNH